MPVPKLKWAFLQTESNNDNNNNKKKNKKALILNLAVANMQLP